MPDVKTTLTKDSDYEITQHIVTTETLARCHPGYTTYMTDMMRERSISKTFNFMAGKITTVYNDAIYQASKYEKFSAAAATSLHVTTEYFTEQPLQLEIEAMHKELVKLGGKPPAIEKIRTICIPGRKG